MRLFCLALLLISSIAWGQNAPLIGLGTPYYSRSFALSTTSACVTTSTSSSTCLLFPGEWVNSSENAKKYVQFGGGAIAANCCWTLDDAGIDIQGLSISDPPSKSGPGACFRLQALEKVEGRANAYDLLVTNGVAAPGSTSGFCSTPWGGASAGGDLLFAPCDADGDCSSFGGGTCTALASLSERQKAYAGARLFCEADSGTPTIYISKMREKYTR